MRILLIISITVVIGILILVASGFYIWHQVYSPLEVKGVEKNIIIEKGEGVKQIASQLKTEKLIRGKFYFDLYIYLTGIRNLQAGEYVLNPSMNIPKIVEIISGGMVNRNEVKITIPEGFTIKQIDERLAKAGLIQPGQLINLDPKLITNHYPLITKLEGYLFPDTYIFNKKAALEEIVGKMADNFNKKITPEMSAEIQKQGKILDQIIILSSIVQQEAVSSEEMPKIAGVFYNRLAISMPLQSDPTVNYITGKSLRQVTAEDITIDSPYNTYKYKGLPPAPICNPGIDAIKAAIWPDKNDYLYFLHPLNAPTVFSKTLEEHNVNKAKWLNGSKQ